MKTGEVHEALQRCAIAAYLALSQQYFAFETVDGRCGVPLDFAAMFAARRTDVWGAWLSLPRAEHERVGRLWQALRQEGDLAQPETFREAVLEYAVAPTALFRIPEESNADEARWLVACHAQEPPALAEHRKLNPVPATVARVDRKGDLDHVGLRLKPRRAAFCGAVSPR